MPEVMYWKNVQHQTEGAKEITRNVWIFSSEFN